MDDFTVETVGELVGDFFGVNYELCSDRDVIILDTKYAHCGTVVSIDMDDDNPVDSERDMQICFCFDLSTIPLIDLKQTSWYELLDVCQKLQEKIAWGTIRADKLKDHENKAHIALYRIIGINELMITPDSGSTLKSLLRKLAQEWESIVPIAYAITTGQKVDDYNFALFMEIFSEENN